MKAMAHCYVGGKKKTSYAKAPTYAQNQKDRIKKSNLHADLKPVGLALVQGV